MLKVDLLPRPWSGHYPRVEGYSPMIRGVVERVSRRKKNAWRGEVLVDGQAVVIFHRDTKAATESRLVGFLEAETKVHYVTRHCVTGEFVEL